MKKIKRTLLSMTVFVTIFYLSTMLNLYNPYDRTFGTMTEVGEAQNLPKDALIKATPSYKATTYASDTAVTELSFSEVSKVTVDNQEAAFTNQEASVTDEETVVVDQKAATADQTVAVDNQKTAVTDQKLVAAHQKVYSPAEATAESEEANSSSDIPASAFEAETSFSEVNPSNSEVTPGATSVSLSIDTTTMATQAPLEATSGAKEAEALYSNIAISIAKDYVNIRKEPSTDSLVLGKLYRDSAAEIIEAVGEWYLVESGSVKGYIRSDLLKVGLSDDELMEKYGTLSIIVKADGLNVRKEPDTESGKLTVIYMNETYPVLERSKEWIKINVEDDHAIGYVKSEFAEITADFKDAVSKEEEEELQRIQAEARAKKETEVKYRDEVNYAKDELKLLACLVHAEAGTQSYEGKLAVANVVLNRVKSSKYPDTMKEVIYQSGQFSVARSGSLEKQLNNYANYFSKSQQLSIKAAKAALEGANNIGTRLYFHSYNAAVKKNYDEKDTCVKIDDHLFW